MWASDHFTVFPFVACVCVSAHGLLVKNKRKKGLLWLSVLVCVELTLSCKAKKNAASRWRSLPKSLKVRGQWVSRLGQVEGESTLRGVWGGAGHSREFQRIPEPGDAVPSGFSTCTDKFCYHTHVRAHTHVPANTTNTQVQHRDSTKYGGEVN